MSSSLTAAIRSPSGERESHTDLVKLLEADPDEVFRHPRHEAAQKLLPELITQLRECENVADGYEFQEVLFAALIETEEARNAASRAVKRLQAGGKLQSGAPEPLSGRDPALLETWLLERDICERVARQFRCVGDALAWRVFGFQRKYIIALCQNAPAGVMAGKEGLVAERDHVRQAWHDGRFALQNDLTNCLRIGDIVIFGNDGSHEIIEVKTDPARRSPAQQRKIKAAEDAVRGAGPLPGVDRRARLYDLDVPFRTRLDLLALGLDRAARDGIFTATVPGARSLLVTDVYGYTAQGWTDDEWQEVLRRRWTSALRKARIGADRKSNVYATSFDSVSRDPMRVPFAAYPLHPIYCSRLIGDLAIVHVETNGPELADLVNAAGIDAEWVRAPRAGDLAQGEVVMEIRTRSSALAPPELSRALHRGPLRMEFSRTLQMRRAWLDMYLIQMLEQDTWLEGIRYMLADPELDGRPWPHYRGEDQVWI
jgi:hypothetical protein